MKAFLHDWPPFFGRGVAGTAAALILALVALFSGESLRVPLRLWPRLALLTFTNVFAWMGFTTLAMRWLAVSEGALLVYTMPIWATLLAWPLAGTRPTARTLIALALGIAGTLVLLGGNVTITSDKALGIALALSAAALFGLGTVLNRSPLGLPPVALVAWQVGLGCAPMIVIGLLFERAEIRPLDTAGWTMLAYMTLIAMALAYVAWFAALRRLPASAASVGMLLVPLIGVLAAAVSLGEPLGPRQIASLALTLSGVTLALRSA